MHKIFERNYYIITENARISKRKNPRTEMQDCTWVVHIAHFMLLFFIKISTNKML